MSARKKRRRKKRRREEELIEAEYLKEFRAWKNSMRAEILGLSQSNCNTVEQTILGLGVAGLGAVVAFPEHVRQLAPTCLLRVLLVGTVVLVLLAVLVALASLVCSHFGLERRAEVNERAQPGKQPDPDPRVDMLDALQKRLFECSMYFFFAAILAAGVFTLVHLTRSASDG